MPLTPLTCLSSSLSQFPYPENEVETANSGLSDYDISCTANGDPWGIVHHHTSSYVSSCSSYPLNSSINNHIIPFQRTMSTGSTQSQAIIDLLHKDSIIPDVLPSAPEELQGQLIMAYPTHAIWYAFLLLLCDGVHR